MTVFRPKDCVSWRYDFWWKGQRYTGSTDLTTRDEAEQFETELRKRLRRRAAGLEPAGPEDTPRFSVWAGVTLEWATKRKKLKRPEQLEINLRMVLGFFGHRPTKTAPIDGAPYHDLRLGDVIADPEWLERFEQWMDQRRGPSGKVISGSRKNHYRSALSLMYRVALLPTHRKRSQVRENPVEGMLRDRVPKRIKTYTAQQLRAIIAAAAWHIRIALAIGALAPKLRLRNVLDLKWGEHVTADLSQIIDPDHKTDRETGLPLVVTVSSELRRVLEIAKAHARGRYVVHYRGKHVEDIKTGLKRAVGDAAIALKDPALVWGRTKGVTYHSLRHTMATELVRMGVHPLLQTKVMGWSDPNTARIYTHMVPADEAAPLEELGARMQVADVIGAPPKRRNAAAGKTVGLAKIETREVAKTRGKSRNGATAAAQPSRATSGRKTRANLRRVG